MSLRVLLVESVAEDVLFLRDVLIEIEAGRFWNNWVHIETLHAASWSEAAAILANEPVDIILLNPDLSDSQGVETFRRVHAAAERIPMILMLGTEDGAMGVRMVREGAQDFVIKREIDCAPLAHAIRNAIERHRLLTSTRAGAINDVLTGLPNRSTFITFADRERKLAERLGRRMMLLIAEPKNLAGIAIAFGEQRRDLTLVEAADHLRGLAGPTDLIARIGECRFGLATLETGFETLESIWARLHSAAESHRILLGAAIFDPDRPVSLEGLLDQASMDMNPNALAMRS
ncbi:MAG: diguanylate cyclase [Acidobacteriia bacterium]|nr:diguanylate cyclase [Terriglobia bacterium]